MDKGPRRELDAWMQLFWTNDDIFCFISYRVRQLKRLAKMWIFLRPRAVLWGFCYRKNANLNSESVYLASLLTGFLLQWTPSFSLTPSAAPESADRHLVLFPPSWGPYQIMQWSDFIWSLCFSKHQNPRSVFTFLYLTDSSVITVRTDEAITLTIYFQLRIKSVHYIFHHDSVEGNAAVTPSANNHCLNKACLSKALDT